MSQDAIKLVNEDGRIVGKDPNTGETIPIELDETRINGIGATLDDEEYRDGAPARRMVHEKSESMLATVGTVIPTTPTRLVTSETDVTSTRWTEIGSVFYGWLESPPNLVPIYRCIFDVDDGGNTLQVRVVHETEDGSTSGVATSITTDRSGRQYLTDQVYFNEVGAPGTGFQPHFMKWTVEAKISDGSGTVYPSSSMILEHEVV